jgi:site-specific recombinase XerD
MKGMRPLTDEEITLVGKSFSGKFASRNKALFILGVRTGFRVSELLSLKVGDVLQRGSIVDRVAVRRGSMKGKAEGRTVVLHNEAKSVLLTYLKGDDTRPDMPLFPSQKAPSEPISRQQVWDILQDAYEANGLTGQLGTHAMRKSFAGRMYKLLNHDLLSTQKALGHKSLASTVSYLSFEQSAVDAAILA